MYTFARKHELVDKIVLSAPILEALYKNTLIELNPGGIQDQKFDIQEEMVVEAKIPGYLGDNQKNICLVVQSVETSLSDSSIQFLGNLLKACKLSFSDVAIVATGNQTLQIKTLKEQLEPGLMILLGVNPVSIGLPINFPLFKTQSYDSTNYLYAPPLEEINQDTDNGKLLKSKLWVCLKQIFQL